MEIALGLNTVIGVMAQVSKRWQLGRLAGTTADKKASSRWKSDALANPTRYSQWRM